MIRDGNGLADKSKGNDGGKLKIGKRKTRIKARAPTTAFLSGEMDGLKPLIVHFVLIFNNMDKGNIEIPPSSEAHPIQLGSQDAVRRQKLAAVNTLRG